MADEPCEPDDEQCVMLGLGHGTTPLIQITRTTSSVAVLL